MKKMILVLVALFIAAPTMAAVTLTKSISGKNVTIGYTDDGAIGTTKARAFALKISADVASGAVITNVAKDAAHNGGHGYGIFPGTIAIDEATGAVTEYNEPLERDNYPVGIGGQSAKNTRQVIIAMGSLYKGDANAPASSGNLVTVTVDKACTLTIEPEATVRGGVIGENAEPLTVLSITAVVPPDVCFLNKSAAMVTDWNTLGQPACWCAPYQCDGDASLGTETLSKYRVFNADLTLIQQNWQKKITDATLNPCADIDHKSETLSKYRVFNADLTKVQQNWQKKDTALVGDCATRVMN